MTDINNKNKNKFKFKFISHKVIHLNFTLNNKFKNKSGQIKIEPKFELSHKKDNNKIIVNLSFKIKNSNSPFFMDVVLSGLFEFDFDTNDEDMDKVVYINISSILFPFLREVVSDVTTRGGFSPLLLQPINFVEAYHKKQEIDSPEKTKKS